MMRHFSIYNKFLTWEERNFTFQSHCFVTLTRYHFCSVQILLGFYTLIMLRQKPCKAFTNNTPGFLWNQTEADLGETTDPFRFIHNVQISPLFCGAGILQWRNIKSARVSVHPFSLYHGPLRQEHLLMSFRGSVFALASDVIILSPCNRKLQESPQTHRHLWVRFLLSNYKCFLLLNYYNFWRK